MDINKDKSRHILDEVKKRRQQKDVVDVDEKTVKLIIFSLSGEYYAFTGDDVKEILMPSEITYVPGTPEFIIGIINVRSDIESVISINGFLGLPEVADSARKRIIIAETDGIRSGILVESIEDVVDVPVAGIKPKLATIGGAVGEYISGETEYGGKNITLIDAKKLFGNLMVS